MDANTFDRWVADAARRPSRRATLRLLAGGLLGAVLGQHRGALAQNEDRDRDGLLDVDEVNGYNHGYFTDPDDWDTDDDGVSDGQEIYNLNNGLGGNTNPVVNENAAPVTNCPLGGPGTDCGGYCASLPTDKYNCGACGNVCPGETECYGGVCTLACYPGQTACPGAGVGDFGYCADLSIDHGNCGRCGNRCSQLGPNYNCVNGTCTKVCKLKGEICTLGNYEYCGDMLCQQSERYAYCVGFVG